MTAEVTRKQGAQLFGSPICPACREPVSGASRCESDFHGGHHVECCPGGASVSSEPNP